MFRSPFLTLLILPGVAAAIAANAAGQALPDGYAGATLSLPGGANAMAATTSGIVYFDGTALWLAEPGQAPRSLLQLPTFAFGSFTCVLDDATVLFGESTSGDLWIVPLGGPSPTAPIAALPFSYDAVAVDLDKVLISARLGGWSATSNDLVLLDLTTGTTQAIGQLPGASGPLVGDGLGGVFYATGTNLFPAPPGQTSILRYPAALLQQAMQQQVTLTTSNALVVAAGLDAASDLAIDDDGDLFFADWFTPGIGRVRNAASIAPTVDRLLSYAAGVPTAAGLEFVRTPGISAMVFEPFQPAGGSLVVLETDFFVTTQVREVRSRRPLLTSSAPQPVPTGPFSLQVSDGPALGVGVLAIGFGTPAGELPLAIAGFEQPLFWDLAMISGPAFVAMPLDGVGQAAVQIDNPGFVVPVSVTAQAAVVSADGVIGSTPATTMTIGS